MHTRTSRTLTAALLLALASAPAVAAVSEDEASALGNTLTEWGAEKAGNADGTIPEYTGGLTTPPANYDKNRPGWRPNPFPDDEPVLRIDAKNMEQHKNKLSAGTMALMQKHENFYIDVYPTRRTASYPAEVLENSKKNATRCNLIADGEGIDTSTGCGFGIPFPIPKNGLEVMWNHDARYRGPAYISHDYRVNFVKPSGEVVVTARAVSYREWGFYDTRREAPDRYFTIRMEYTGPARLNGQTSMWHDMLANGERRAWSYQPSTRRVRVSPDLAADMPVSQTGGAMVYDEDQMFSGKKDRYNWELVGKKEMYIPYNTYDLQYPDASVKCSSEERLTPYFVNPKCTRWELHRVWHVKATLKDGKRHIYKTRDFYLDEDSYSAGISENYDQAGNLYRFNIQPSVAGYDANVPSITDNYVIDMISGVYAWMAPEGGHEIVTPLNPAQLVPETMNRFVVR